MFSFAMTSGLASDSDKFKIIITLRRAQKFEDMEPYKNLIFLNNPLTEKFFWKFELNAMGRICPISLKGLNGLCDGSVHGCVDWLNDEWRHNMNVIDNIHTLSAYIA